MLLATNWVRVLMRKAKLLSLCLPWLVAIAAYTSGYLSAAEPSAKTQAELLGRRIESFTLQDFRGESHSLGDYADQQAIVLCFLGTECPLAKLYVPRLQKLSEQFSGRGVAFVGVSSNSQDSITELAAYARIHGLTFPILKDLGQKLADQCGATRTP